MLVLVGLLTLFDPDAEVECTGTAERNLGPVTEALAPLTALALETSSDQRRPHVLELASHPYTHITHWAQRWSKLEWCGSVRDGQQAA